MAKHPSCLGPLSPNERASTVTPSGCSQARRDRLEAGPVGLRRHMVVQHDDDLGPALRLGNDQRRIVHIRDGEGLDAGLDRRACEPMVGDHEVGRSSASIRSMPSGRWV